MQNTNKALNVFRENRKEYYTRQPYPFKLSGEYLSCSLPVRMAKLLLEITEKSQARILENELIVGWQSYMIYPLLSKPEYLLAENEITKIESETGIFTVWQGLYREEREEGLTTIDYEKGHIIVDYEKVLKQGFSGIKKEIEKRLEGEEDREKSDYGKALMICCNAAIKLGEKYSAHAQEISRTEKDENRKRTLRQISEVCGKVPREPAASFWEALQSVWFTQLLLNVENAVGATSFGRMDQYLFPYYQADRDKGVSEDHLKALLFSFLTKICYYLDFTFESNMPITIGGTDDTGKDATNQLTWWFLEFIEQYKLPEPKITLRVHRHTPEDLLRYAARILGLGAGSPQLVNDDYIIPMLKDLGLSHTDASDYGMVGCTGPSAVKGRELGWESGGGFINLAKILELTLHKIRVPPENFSQLLALYKEEIHGFLDSFIGKINIIDRHLPMIYPTPFQSSLMEHCIENLADMGSGCVPYNFTHYPGAGIANVANSLLAVKKIVFEEKKVSLLEFIAILKNNFKGQEKLREYILHRLPRFGNDEEEVDGLAAEIAAYYLGEVRRHRNGRNGFCRGGIASYTHNVILGEKTGALPDGRKQGEPLSQGFAPSQGTDRTSPTATINSVAGVTRTAGPTNVAFTFTFPPYFFKNEEMASKVSALLEAYFAQGGMQIQVNVTDLETLKAAIKEPDKYSHLVVRVCGYSAYFVDLPQKLQKEIISRYEYD